MKITETPSFFLEKLTQIGNIVVEEGENNAIAVFDKPKKYRYFLGRSTGSPGNKTLVWLMLNPSTADAFKLDPTVTRCFKRSQKYGANRMVILNLFAYRSPYPKDLYIPEDPIGPHNDLFIQMCNDRKSNTSIVFAWGGHPKVKNRISDVLTLLNTDIPTFCLGHTQDGMPVHPLHIPYSQGFVPYLR